MYIVHSWNSNIYTHIQREKVKKNNWNDTNSTKLKTIEQNDNNNQQKKIYTKHLEKLLPVKSWALKLCLFSFHFLLLFLIPFFLIWFLSSYSPSPSVYSNQCLYSFMLIVTMVYRAQYHIITIHRHWNRSAIFLFFFFYPFLIQLLMKRHRKCGRTIDEKKMVTSILFFHFLFLFYFCFGVGLVRSFSSRCFACYFGTTNIYVFMLVC